jgi:hypothetical protein
LTASVACDPVAISAVIRFVPALYEHDSTAAFAELALSTNDASSAATMTARKVFTDTAAFLRPS